ncbi:MAG: NAD-dependent epimerase/dehydratase family protein [Nitriliruptorales bacterium]|nr:NAD-dependent epimerase/dehydratase family protein [Nitriliruptorales bacterium]
MSECVLITGGAGFIGSHVGRELLHSGFTVRALDDLNPQVHEAGARPHYLDDDVELVIGDLRDPQAVSRALDGVDDVVHFAARVGVGQSMYEIADYTSVNTHGTGVLLDAMAQRDVGRLLVASSMSVYGEGLYRAPDGTLHDNIQRTPDQLARKQWDPLGLDGESLEPLPTPETKPPSLSSVYALGKYDQERMCLLYGAAYGVPTVALRFFNVYGPDQALSNPYTGVLAIFAARLLNNRPPMVFEDGEQRRDFVAVQDVARACHLALIADDAVGHVLNIGSGRSATVTEVAEQLAKVTGKSHIEPEVTGKYRVGDIRHCFADITLARELLAFEPAIDLEEGVAALAQWLEGQVAVDRVDDAAMELSSRGLAR